VFYFIGDIHGYLDKLTVLMDKLLLQAGGNDTMVFLGDYIDRGKFSSEVVDYLISLSKKTSTVFLKGNHEDMLLKYLSGKDDGGVYLFNGGDATINSYKKNFGKFVLPDRHLDFFNSLLPYFEGDDFIAVHAGLDPKIDNIEVQDGDSILWIRDKFFRCDKRWSKTVIFGHTPTFYMCRDSLIYDDAEKNIIGIDTGVYYGRPLVGLRWPDKKIFTS